MKAFQMKDDENRIYFRNYERIPAEKELSTLVNELKEAGCQVGAKRVACLDDIYECKKDGMSFSVVFTGEEAFIYSESKETIKSIMKLFEY